MDLIKTTIRAELPNSEYFNFDSWISDTSRNLVVELNRFVWGEKLEPKIIEYLENWKEAFKERWFPEWAKRKWPVKKTRHAVSFDILYPDFQPKLPDEKHSKIGYFERQHNS